MMEMRCYDTGDHKVLQYRQKIDVTIRAGMGWSQDQLASTANYQWSVWTVVPTVESPMVNDITAESVSHLRDISDAPMMECKKALTVCRGDMQKAIEWLRTK